MNLLDISIVKRYAVAYMRCKGDTLEKRIDDLKKLIEISKPYSTILRNPAINYDIKNEILKKIVPQDLIKSVAFNLVALLVKQKRFNLIEQIYEKSYEILLKLKNKIKVIVYSKHQLSESNYKMISEFFKNAGLGEPVIEWHQRSDYIGGFVMKWDDIIIDATINSKIEKIRKAIKEGVVL